MLNRKRERAQGNGMATKLTPTQEHYLKRELLKYQLNKEFAYLNDRNSLRRFGYPFTAHNPKQATPKSLTPSLFRRVMRTTNSLTSEGSSDDRKLSANNNSSAFDVSDFPMLSFMLQKFIMPFPLLSEKLSGDGTFWQGKVQVFFEHFMSLEFSDSFDRDQTTKRRKMAQKISKIVLLIFNSGIGSSLENHYYNEDKFKFLDEGARERSKIEEFAIPTRQNLLDLVTNEAVYINGWDVNIISVVENSALSLIARVTSTTTEESDEEENLAEPHEKTCDPVKSKSRTSLWMKSAIDMTTTTTTSLFSRFSIAETKHISPKPKPKHAFIIKIRKQSNDDSNACRMFYISKSYNDFKRLSRQLKSQFPGKDLPKFSHENKKGMNIVTSIERANINQTISTPTEKIISRFETENISVQAPIGNSSEADEEYGDEDEQSSDEYEDASNEKSNNLPLEQLRTALRQYIRNLLKDKEVALSSIFSEFLDDTYLEQDKFGVVVLEDIKNRELVDITNLENQISFQKLALEKSIELQDMMVTFKESFLKDKIFLLSLIHELRDNTKVEQLSPLLQNFIEWCKVYLASTIYQLFLGNDNSYEFYSQIRRLHRLMPYTVMAQIMRFTNPMAIMKGMMELFMSQPFGRNSLLQTMFSHVLSDDLKTQEKIIKELEGKIIDLESEGKSLIDCLRSAIFENENSEYISMKDVPEKSNTLGMPAVIIILMECSDKGFISERALSYVLDSYASWKLQVDSRNTSTETQYEESNAVFFSHVKMLLQLYVQERDKMLMKKMWQDPELIQLLKHIFTMIYEPIVKIFKVARVDIALKNFEKFMNDLIKLMDKVINGEVGTSIEFNIVEAISDLVTTHQDSFFEFVHNVYINDTENIFEGFISWILNIIDFLQNSKYGDDSERINFDELLKKSNVNTEEVVKEIDEVIDQKISGRKMYNELLELKVKDMQKDNKKPVNILKNNWDHINSVVLPDNTLSFGVEATDLVDLELDVSEDAHLNINPECELEIKYQQILKRQIDTAEIQKLAGDAFEVELKKFLKQNGV